MSQVSVTQESRLEALQRLGYSPREAGFLCLAGLHSGYFLRRQYARFLGRAVGGTTAALVDRLVANGHVKAMPLAHNAALYHLCARPFYTALGQEDNRNRREKQPFTIKNKLMALDFVLDHSDKRFLATEQEKTDYFSAAVCAQRATLPAKLYRSASSPETTARYFVEKYPIFVEEHPTFCFVDEGLTTSSRFETFLAQYGRLFAALPRFHVLYVAASPIPFRWVGPAFERVQAKVRTTAPDPDTARLHEHFSLRRQFESKDLSAFDRDKLIRFRNERQEFSGPRCDGLYEQWKVHGNGAVLNESAAQHQPAAPAVGTFSTYLLSHNYDLFGTLTAF